MNSYKVLNKQLFSIDNYSIIPIRYEDRLSILKWRNEQLYHLRQEKKLTKNDQENYFNNIVNKLFDQDRPNQILFSLNLFAPPLLIPSTLIFFLFRKSINTLLKFGLNLVA